MSEELPKFWPGHAEQERKMLEIMEVRHRNAVIALQLEKFLGDVGNTVLFDADDKPTKDEQKIESRALEIARLITKDLPKPYLSGGQPEVDYQKNRIEESAGATIKNYLKARHDAQVVSWIISKNYKVELDTEAGAFNAGYEIFTKVEGKRPTDHVKASLVEGYWILRFDNPTDFQKFTKETDVNTGLAAGIFSKFRVFEGIPINIIAVNPDNNTMDEEIVIHERQHFIHHLLFDFDGLIEFPLQRIIKDVATYPTLSRLYEKSDALGYIDRPHVQRVYKGLLIIKDELLAYLRDGSSFRDALSFLEDKIYGHILENFIPEETEEINQLMSDIRKALYKLPLEFDSLNGRALLVYHLLDVPLHKMPQRIKYIAEYYKNESDKFKYLLPNEPKLDGSISDDDYDKAVEIRDKIWELVDEPRRVLFSDLDYENQKRRMAEQKKEIEQLREEYDKLVNS
jgi:hypothetical protein